MGVWVIFELVSVIEARRRRSTYSGIHITWRLIIVIVVVVLALALALRTCFFKY